MTVGPPDSDTEGTMSYARATSVTPMKITPSSTAIATSVLPAFFDSGGLNAGTPLAIASTPVSATEPLANARRSRTTVSVSVPSGTASGWRGIGTTVPATMCETPFATISRARPTNRYVGIAKMFPDSRRPRRLPTVISAITPTATGRRHRSRPGAIEISWSIADDVETATVIT